MSVATELGGHAAPVCIEWSGGTLQIKAMDWGAVLVGLENWQIERDAELKMKIDGKMVEKGLLTREECVTRMDAFTSDATDGRFGYGSDKMMAVFNSAFAAKEGKTAGIHAGVFQLLALMTGLPMGDAFQLMQEKKGEVMAALTLVMKRSQPDPKDLGQSAAA